MTDHHLNALPKGHRLQEYELVRVLGHGGFGITYLGYDHNLDKAVAVKEYLPVELVGRTSEHSVAPQTEEYQADFAWGLERFLDEARTLARFKHPNIIPVHRFFEAHGTAYIVMEYAEGETLEALLERKGALKEDDLKPILLPLLDGLAQVHAAGVLHRDIKPGNIMLRDADGSPVLVDFGSARQAIGARSRSMTAVVTPGYGPIEQYSTRGRQGPWTDLYALGGVCYRALTGNAPEEATERVRRDPQAPAVEAARGGAGNKFLRAIDWALRIDEDDRPQDVAAWRAALLGQKEAPPASEVVPPPSRPRRFGLGTALALMLLLSMGAWLGWRTYQREDAEKQAAVAEDARQQTEAEKRAEIRQTVTEVRQQVASEIEAEVRQAVAGARQQVEAELQAKARQAVAEAWRQAEAEKRAEIKRAVEEAWQQAEAEIQAEIKRAVEEARRQVEAGVQEEVRRAEAGIQQQVESELQAKARQAVAEAWREVEAQKRAEAGRAVEEARRQVAAERPAAGEKSKDLRRWRKLVRGLSRDQVTELLGAPDRVEGGPFERWDYPLGGEVMFYQNEGVYRWEEPRT